MVERINLNENDKKLLSLCMNKEQSVNDIAKFLNISPASVSVKIKKLKQAGLIKIEDASRGKKKFIRAIKGDKTTKYMKEVLRRIEKNKGEMWFEDYLKIFTESGNNLIDDPKGSDKSDALIRVEYSYPKLIRMKFHLTDLGRKFLKEK